MASYLLGLDIGTSAVKAALLRVDDGKCCGEGSSPDSEMEILSPKPGWAEQHPEVWWENAVFAIQRALKSARVSAREVKAVGIAYQMHGLVVLDEQLRVVRPAIIWCDSRAVEAGHRAEQRLGSAYCLDHFRNTPGNFTVAKLLWMREQEPELFARVRWAMLPGDYIALRMSGQIVTSFSGLSEAIAWDFKTGTFADSLNAQLDLPATIFPTARPSMSHQGEISSAVANELGLAVGTPISYRAGDQPNNALALGVVEPGSIAMSAGTSGVLFGVTTQSTGDPHGRVNIFLHANATRDDQRSGVLLCLNGVGSAMRWIRNSVFQGESYPTIDKIASEAPIGANSLVFLPFGNGSERVLGNRTPGSAIFGVDFNRHSRADLGRAVVEGIACFFRFGSELLADRGVRLQDLRGSYSSLFRSPIFRSSLANVLGKPLKLFSTDGAQGAARGAGLGAGIFRTSTEALIGLECAWTEEPSHNASAPYEDLYSRWLQLTERQCKEML